jgi:predicted O-linked N-acetylglucosamine transferase (SPINDLY family)
MTLEFQLLLACASVKGGEATAIRRNLEHGIDWTLFARLAVRHGLAAQAGRALNCLASDAAPREILDAFHAIEQRCDARNRALLDEIATVTGAFADSGIKAIVCKGPVLATLAGGDSRIDIVQNLPFLIRSADFARAIAAMRDLGYNRQTSSNKTRAELAGRLRGHELLYKKGGETCIALHTRPTATNLAVDADISGLWRRARHATVKDRNIPVPAPEDAVLILAIEGADELWRNIHPARDFAIFIGSHPNLDWTIVTERARAQGCWRMLLVVAALSRECFGQRPPDSIIVAARRDPIVERMVELVKARWQAVAVVEPPSDKAFSLFGLRLHDGARRRARYIVRTGFLTGLRRVASVRLWRWASAGRIPIKIVRRVPAQARRRPYRQMRLRAARLLNALAASGPALAILPGSAETKQSMRRHHKSRADAKRALAADPKNGAAWRDLGDALAGLRRYGQALACYDKVLAIVPDHRPTWERRSAAARAIGRKMEPDVPPDTRDANTWAIRAGFLWFSGRLAQAAEAADHALALDPAHLVATRVGIRCRLQGCDWSRRDDDRREVAARLAAGTLIVGNIDHLGMCDSEAQLRLGAEYAASAIVPVAEPLWRGERYRHEKIRIAYVSADLHNHATAFLIAGLFEHHDKARFETTAISLGRDDAGEMRRRIAAAFDRFIDVQTMPDAEVAGMIRELEIDIAIDLKGYTGGARTGIFAYRPAPVQVNYLGYPGTMAAPFIDYIIADRVVIPEEHQINYSEKVVYLPWSYQPNDRNRGISGDAPTRTEAGLPQTGFVFACFNNSYKIGPEMFAIWMRLLRAVENSVLWLLETSAGATANLRREASVRGIAPERLIFAPRRPQSEHLSRQRLADLFLDTLPCNAHTTASDALSAGLPVLTCKGETFAGRVASSLLHAIGLPELVTSSLADYETSALALARDPKALAAIKRKLARNRMIEPLFDTARYTRDLETAYAIMWERSQRGDRPESFSVAKARYSTAVVSGARLGDDDR